MTRYWSAIPVRATQLLGVMLLAMLAAAPVAWAQSGAIAQSYPAAGTSVITQGELLSLAASGSGLVEPATAGNAGRLIGVAVINPALALSGGAKNSVQVAVGGSAEVMVSDANGTVKAGDKIMISPLAGVGMKASGSGEVLGTAQKSLGSVKTVAQQAKGKGGQNVTVRVGLVPVAINAVYYSAPSAGGSFAAYVPPFLQEVANSVAGKAVSPLRVLLGAAALLFGFFTVTVMIYTSVRSGVISLGRNPLAAGALRSGMADVLIAALGVLVVTGVIVAAVILA